jgi:periplasmic copper chaperone A
MFLLIFLMTFINTPKDKIEIQNAWLRTAGAGMNTAMFFDIVNNSDKPDTLYKVESDLAELVQIHETYKNGDMMGMREVKNVVVKPHSTFKFKPGGHHVMFINLKNDIKEGDKTEVTFFFKVAGKMKVEVPIKNMITE